MAKELPKRSEVKEEYTWNLKDVYATTELWNADLQKIQDIGEQVAKLEGKVSENSTNLFEALQGFETIELTASRLFHYAFRLSDEDTGNSENRAMAAKISAVYADVCKEIAFLDPEILAIAPEKLEQFYQENSALEAYRKHIEEICRLRAHTLSTEMEKLIAMTSEMSQVAENTFSVLDNADMQFPEISDENGETVRITHGRYITLLQSANREVRKNAFEKYYGTYEKFLRTYASLYDGQVKQQVFHAKARKYDSALEAAVSANNVPVSVYKNLVETVNKNLDKLHRYVRLRKKCLQVDELHMYDVYTPIISDIAEKIPYEEAKETVIKALAPMGEEYISILQEGFDNRWIDVYENQGKQSGAYSSTTYGVHPYVMLNHDDTLEDMFTIAHEMGHSLHSYYSDRTQPFLYSQYKIFVAEVASTVNEVLLLEYLLKNAKSKEEKVYLLNHYLDMFKGTLFRQTQFAEFEMLTNEMVEKGEALNEENLSKLYLEINKKYYGEDMISDKEISREWARIPHFYYNFYVYQYATSFSAAVAIAKEILEKGKPVVENYITEFLSGGCSKPPVELLKCAGVNLETPEPIQAALDTMDAVLDEIEGLLND